MTMDVAIGIDVGGTNTKYGVVSRAGSIIARGVIQTGKEPDARQYVNRLYHAVQPVLHSFGGGYRFCGIGVGAPNANHKEGIIEYAPNLQWQGVVPLAQILQQKFNLPCYLTNDANAAVLGEMQGGAATGYSEIIMITLGTGLGSAIVCNGRLVYGLNGYAGELGHMTVVRNGRSHWKTDIKGSLESYVSATGIVITVQEKLQHDVTGSRLASVAAAEMTAEVVYDYACRGDVMAKEVFTYTGTILGEALANVVMVTSPQIIVVGGGVSIAAPYFLPAAIVAMEQNLLPIFKNRVQVVPGKLPGADAAIIGAASLVWE